MASQDTGSKPPGLPEIKHIGIHHRRYHEGFHESPTEKLVKAKDAHHPPNLPLSEKLVANETKTQAGGDPPEAKKSVKEVTPRDETSVSQKHSNVSRIVPFGPTDPLPYPNSCIGKITVGTGDQVLWTGTGIMCQPKLLLTAGHTCPWEVKNPWMTFAPGYSDGNEPYGVANITGGYGYNVSPPSEFDMAICVLDQDIGESCGWGATVWNTSDSGYNQDPFQAFLESAGYSNSTDPSDDQQYIYSGDDYDITVPSESGHFKLLNFPIAETPYNGAVLWTYFNNIPCCAGVMSGIDGNDPPSGLGFAGGEALGDLLNYAIQHWGGY